MKNKTLVQIISKQTMPNLLAAMAVKPDQIVHICTPAMKMASDVLSQSYREAEVRASVTTVAVGEKPLMREMFKAVSAAIEGKDRVVVNFTGGTKPMSIGAYGAASAARAPSFYVDTDRGEFLDGETGRGLVEFFENGDFSLEQVNRQLTVNAITKANGVERVTGGRKWADYAPLADLLLRNEKIEQRCHDFASEIVQKTPRDFAQQKEWWRTVYAKPVQLPDEVSQKAVDAGLFEDRDGKLYPARRWFEKLEHMEIGNGQFPGKVIFAAFEEAQWPFSFFNGNWWEVAVIRHFSLAGKMRDLRWSVEAGSRTGGSTNMEEDILGVDGVNLLYVSCKRGGDKAKLSRTLEDVNSSGLRLGGEFAHRVIAIYKEITGRSWNALSNRCRELHLQLLTRADVMKTPSFQ